MIVSIQGRIQNKPGPLAPPTETKNKVYKTSFINYTWQTTTKTKNNSTFIFLNNLLEKIQIEIFYQLKQTLMHKHNDIGNVTIIIR